MIEPHLLKTEDELIELTSVVGPILTDPEVCACWEGILAHILAQDAELTKLQAVVDAAQEVITAWEVTDLDIRLWPNMDNLKAKLKALDGEVEDVSKTQTPE